MRLTLHTFLTLDGVMQSPGGRNEDPDGPFEYGGWSFAYGDEEVDATVAGWFEKAEAFLLGRKTYQIFSGYWPNVTDPDNPIATKLNALKKYVASTTPRFGGVGPLVGARHRHARGSGPAEGTARGRTPGPWQR
jgi:dihydrofolate reductase